MGRRVVAVAGVAAAAAVLGSTVTVASAEPVDPTAGAVDSPRSVGARLDRVEQITDTRTALFVESTAMGRIVQVQVLHPANETPRPSLYLLDGVGAGEESDYSESTWTLETDAVDFFADKPVNVVLPVGGTGAYYTDWLRPDSGLGQPQWETFLTEELPRIIDSEMHGNGANAVAGVSMGAMGAGNLITRHPDLYRGLTAFSGCLDTTDPIARDSVRSTVAYKGGDAANMWGFDSDPAWTAHNPAANAEALRGKQIYVSTGNGLPGRYETGGVADAPRIAIGGPLEAAANYCTQSFERKMNAMQIPATIVYHDQGTHSWPYWQDEMRRAWPDIARALEI